MERYLESEQLTPSSERKSSRSWTTFLSSVERRPSSLPLESAAGSQSSVVSLPQPPQQQQQQPQMLPVSFMFHRHCSTPSPTASSSPFSLASPASLGATTPDDDGTNPVDVLCFLNIDGVAGRPQSGGNVSGDIVSSSSSSSSTTSWDSTRSDPDVPIPGPSTPLTRSDAAPVHQRYVRRPTELRLTPGTASRRVAAWPSPCRATAVDSLSGNVSNKNAACFRRIAKRRWRTTGFAADDIAPPTVAGSTSPSVIRHAVSSPRPTSVSVGVGRSRWPPSHSPPHPNPKLPSLPSPAEMAYLRSLSGCVGSRSLDPEAAKRGLTDTIEERSIQRLATPADRSCPQLPPLPLPPSTTSMHDNSRLVAVEDSTSTSDPVGTDKKQLRVYGCSIVECGKLYSKSSHLKAHMRSHTGKITICWLFILSKSMI